MLCKTSSIFGIASVILIDAFLRAMRREGLSRRVEKGLDSAALSALIVMAVFLSGLAVYDYAYNAFPSPLAHLDFILNYHSSLSYKCTENVMLLYCIHKDSPYSKEGVVIDLPLRWTIPINTFAPAPYYVTEVSVDGYSYKPIAYYGIYSPIWWLTWAVLIFTAPTALRSLLQLFSRKYGSISEEGHPRPIRLHLDLPQLLCLLPDRIRALTGGSIPSTLRRRSRRSRSRCPDHCGRTAPASLYW